MKFVKDDGGRRAAGYRVADDCVVRSIALVSGRKYREVRQAAAVLIKKNPKLRAKGTHRKEDGVENGVDDVIARKLAKQMGLVRAPFCRPNMSFADVGKVYRTAVCSTNEHWTAIVNGVLRDTDDFRHATSGGELKPRKARTVWVKPAKLKKINEEIEVIDRLFRHFVNYRTGKAHKNGFGVNHGPNHIGVAAGEGRWRIIHIDTLRDYRRGERIKNPYDSIWAALHILVRNHVLE